MKALKFAKIEDRVESLATQQESSLQLDALPGIWLNTDGDTRGILKVVISSKGPTLKIRVFGAAEPSPCDWGEVDAEYVYANHISSQNAAGFSAWYRLDHAEINLQANWNQGLLVLASFTSFKDGSGRSNYFSREFFHH